MVCEEKESSKVCFYKCKSILQKIQSIECRSFFHMLLPRSCASKWYQWLRIWLSRNIRFVSVNVAMSARNRHFQTNYWCITIWLFESDPNAPSTWSEPGGKQWQPSIRGRRNWDVELGPCAVIRHVCSVAFVWETKRPQADNSRSLIDRQVSCYSVVCKYSEQNFGHFVLDIDLSAIFVKLIKN